MCPSERERGRMTKGGEAPTHVVFPIQAPRTPRTFISEVQCEVNSAWGTLGDGRAVPSGRLGFSCIDLCTHNGGAARTVRAPCTFLV